MKNAHLRFGTLTYLKALKSTCTNIKVPLDRFVGERSSSNHCRAHLISAFGGDTQIAALAAALGNRDAFTIQGPDSTPFQASLGGKPTCYRASIQLPGRKHSLRHLVAVSEELAATGAGKNAERAILFHNSTQFIWHSLADVHGLPGASEWADWIVGELQRLRAIVPLSGIGCSPVLVKGSRGMILNSISRGLRDHKIHFPKENGSIHWKKVSLSDLLRQDTE